MGDWTKSDAAIDEHYRGIYGYSYGVDPIEGKEWKYEDLDVVGEWNELEEEMEVELDG